MTNIPVVHRFRWLARAPTTTKMPDPAIVRDLALRVACSLGFALFMACFVVGTDDYRARGALHVKYMQDDLVLFAFTSLIVSPIFENLLFAAPVLLLMKVGAPTGYAVALCAIAAGALHATSSITWGTVAVLPFVVFTLTMVAYRKSGFFLALLASSAVHALNNLVALSFLLLL